MTTKEIAFKKITKLVQRFSGQIDSYQCGNYNETMTRRDFIDPLFKLLGWDIDNENDYAESYREVIHEDRVSIGGSTKAPDYSFRLVGGKRLFFVEAKKPSVIIKKDQVAAYQIRHYGWNAKLPISIITNFEEFAVYDCTIKPFTGDIASKSRIRYLTFREYLEEFDFLWETFGKENVPKGSLDRFVQGDSQKRGTTTVDREFLQSLDSWRATLATSVFRTNNHLTEDEINFVVQQMINRIIFLRIAEDRGVEPQNSLKNALVGDCYYENLLSLFIRADDKYDSGLFDFAKDTLSKTLVIENKAFKSIIDNLYYPGPYNFSVMPVEILGSAYERFLGKTIRITSRPTVKIEEKPEIRRAGGVYYTPQYIVDFIVQKTIGGFLKKKTPKDVEKIKLIDPACGSGSFLLGAYQHLLDWHRDYYIGHGFASRGKKHDLLTPEGNLTTAEKKRILLNNIFGVDIDANAVEVTKLSLLLKCLEGETEASINTQLHLFHDRVLPMIDDNIKCGNSLIDMDFFNGRLHFGDEKKIKPFHWKKEFAAVFKQGGFDFVLGNPPWGVDFDEDSLKYLRERNHEIVVRMIDSYMYFIFEGYKILKPHGFFGMILPDVFLYQTDNEKLRRFLWTNAALTALLNLGNVFENVTRPSCIAVFAKKTPKPSQKITTIDLTAYKKQDKERELHDPRNCRIVLRKSFETVPGFRFVTKNIEHYSILARLGKIQTKPLADFVDQDGIQRGVSPDLNNAFLVTSKQAKEFQLEKSHLRKVVTGGRHVKRYHIRYPDLLLVYTDKSTDFKTIPHICSFIKQFRNEISCKEVQQGKHSLYSLHRARQERIFTKSVKLLGVITEDEIIVSIDDKMTYATDGLYLFGVENIDMKFLMGILNSKLFIFLYRLASMEKGRVLAQVKPTIISKMPIRIIDENNKDEKKIRDNIIEHVKSLLQLNEEKSQAKLPNDISGITAKINFYEEKINDAVYRLYGLDTAEIRMIEEEIG